MDRDDIVKAIHAAAGAAFSNLLGEIGDDTLYVFYLCTDSDDGLIGLFFRR